MAHLLRWRHMGQVSDEIFDMNFEFKIAKNSCSDSDIALLDIESQNLRDAKEEFYKILPADDRFEGSRSKQDPAAVVVLVNSAIQGWEKKHESSKFGKAKKLFHKVCSSIDQHSTLLEILPQQNEYVALFYGTVQVVIKVRGILQRPLVRKTMAPPQVAE